jgi:hypothetical protein
MTDTTTTETTALITAIVNALVEQGWEGSPADYDIGNFAGDLDLLATAIGREPTKEERHALNDDVRAELDRRAVPTAEPMTCEVLDAGPVTSSAYLDTAGAVDVDVTIRIGGRTVEGEVTLVPSDDGNRAGVLVAYGSPDHWISRSMLAALETLPPSAFREALSEIENAAAAVAAR